MGFPQVFYCVCEEPGCVWNRPRYQAFGRCVVNVEKDGVHRYIEPDDRPTRIVGSLYWNTCRYFSVIVFEAIFIRTLRNLVRDRVVSVDDLPDVLDHLVRARRYDSVFLRVHARAIRRIVTELGYLERELGTMNGHLVEIARLAENFVNQNRVILDQKREPRYWPTRAVALAALQEVSARRRAAREAVRAGDSIDLQAEPQPAQELVLPVRQVA